MKKKIILFTLFMMGFYLLVSFVLWEFNSSLWPIEARLMYALFATPFSLLLASSDLNS